MPTKMKVLAIGVHSLGYVLMVVGCFLYDFRLALIGAGSIVVFEMNKK